MLNPILTLAAKFVGDKLREHVTAATENDFARTVRAVARRCNFTVTDLDHESATIDTGLSAYPVALAQLADGKVLVMVFSKAVWRGRPPAAAHALMERLDADHQTATFSVKELGSGRTRCLVHSVARDLDVLSSSGFWRAVGDMSGQMDAADRMLARHGYA